MKPTLPYLIRRREKIIEQGFFGHFFSPAGQKQMKQKFLVPSLLLAGEKE